MEDDVLRRIEAEMAEEEKRAERADRLKNADSERPEVQDLLGFGRPSWRGSNQENTQKRYMEEYARMQERARQDLMRMYTKDTPKIILSPPRDPCEMVLGKNRYIVLLELMQAWIAKETSLTAKQRMDVSVYMLERLEEEINRDPRYFTPTQDDQTQNYSKPRQIDLSDDPAYGTFPPGKTPETP